MTCRHRHSSGDPNCGSNRYSYDDSSGKLRATEAEPERLRRELTSRPDPDNSKFELLDMVQVGKAMVVKVRYESCPKCSYEGMKVLVYADASPIDVAKWRVVDPHFSDRPQASSREAPSPIARFPASPTGMGLAVKLAQMLEKA